MFKIFFGFVAGLAFVSMASAVEVKIVKNTKKLGDGREYVVTFDGEAKFDSALMAKALACHKKFETEGNQVNKEALLELVNVDQKSQARSMASESVSYITLDTRELNETFVTTTFKECLSK